MPYPVSSVRSKNFGSPLIPWWAIDGIDSNCVFAIQPVGAATQTASYSNRANPGTRDAEVVSAPSWDTSTGWSFSNTQNLKVQNIPALNTNALTLVIRTTYTSGTYLCGSASGKNVYINNSAGVIGSDGPSWGAFSGDTVLLATGLSGDTVRGFVNGVFVASRSSTHGVWNSTRMAINGVESGGSFILPSVQTIKAIGLFSTSFSDSTAAKVSAAIASLP